MSEAPELLWLWPAEPEDGVDKFVSFPGQPYPSDSTTYIRADLADALLREAAEALEEIAVRDSLPTPSFGGVKPGQYAYINRAGPLAEIAHATLAKLRAHLGEDK